MLDEEARKKERDRLIRQYYELDEKYQRAKGIRMTIAILFFSLLYFVILLKISGGAGIEGILLLAVVSLVFGSIHFGANITIFSQMIYKSREENEHLKYIENRIRELEKRDFN